MTEIQVLCVMLTQLGVGGLLLAGLLPPRVVRASFFKLNCLITALALVLTLVLTRALLPAVWPAFRYLGLTLAGSLIAYGLFRIDRGRAGRVVMLLAAVLGLVFGVLPMADQILTLRGIQTSATMFFGAGILSGLLLLGATHISMILGHWYLIDRKMPFGYLAWFTRLLILAVVLRGLLLVITLLLLDNTDPLVAERLLPLPQLGLASGKLFFFCLRVVLGILIPLTLGFLVLRCVRTESNQAATGLLYVAEICVLFGELFAAYLLL